MSGSESLEGSNGVPPPPREPIALYDAFISYAVFCLKKQTQWIRIKLKRFRLPDEILSYLHLDKRQRYNRALQRSGWTPPTRRQLVARLIPTSHVGAAPAASAGRSRPARPAPTARRSAGED